MRDLAASLAALLVACPSPQHDPAPDTGPTSGWEPGNPVEITVQTRDGLDLVGDFYAASRAERPGLLLLHMNPVYYDRHGWPSDFIEALNTRDWAVLNLDRRGAGDSEGSPEDAFLGQDGRYDAEAGVRYLLDTAGCDPDAIALLGASNGTTTALDYATWVPDEEDLPTPAAMVFMTGGVYTENNSHMSGLTPLPLLFTYSTDERDWSEQQRALDPGSWLFLEYADGDHGTQMFEAAPEVVGDIGEFLSAALRTDPG